MDPSIFFAALWEHFSRLVDAHNGFLVHAFFPLFSSQVEAQKQGRDYSLHDKVKFGFGRSSDQVITTASARLAKICVLVWMSNEANYSSLQNTSKISWPSLVLRRVKQFHLPGVLGSNFLSIFPAFSISTSDHGMLAMVQGFSNSGTLFRIVKNMCSRMNEQWS